MRYQRIVCAANRLPDGTILIGARHWDKWMHQQNDGRVPVEPNTHPGVFEDEEQGFIDNRGNFLSRTEAWKVADEAGQIIYRVGGDTADGGTLYSENLY